MKKEDNTSLYTILILALGILGISLFEKMKP